MAELFPWGSIIHTVTFGSKGQRTGSQCTIETLERCPQLFASHLEEDLGHKSTKHLTLAITHDWGHLDPYSLFLNLIQKVTVV